MGHPIFSDLPLEIRRQIWTHALPDAGTVLFRFGFTVPSIDARIPFPRSRIQLRENHSPKSHFSCRLPVPAVLHVCREARREALRFIRVISCSDSSSNSGTTTPLDWWNPWIDTLYVSSCIAPSRENPGWVSPTAYPQITGIELKETIQAQISAVRHLAWGFEHGWLFWRRNNWVNCGLKCWDWIDMARWLRTSKDLESFTWVVDSPKSARTHDYNPSWIDHPEYSTVGNKMGMVFPRWR
ncbi:hypothetical protein ACMFMF_010211 [Clarireedia jacksonii]